MRASARTVTVVLLAVFAFGVLTFRACTQSIVIDEADSYLLFASGSWPEAAIYPSSGNHVLNTILEGTVTRAFGASEFTLRVPALLGAAIYLAAAVFLALAVFRPLLPCAAFFICLTFNPLLMDYLVAARGYSLAVAFLLAAAAIFTRVVLLKSVRVQHAALFSLCLGLSFSANFAFAFAGVALWLVFSVWLGRRYALLAASAVPGILVAGAICGWTLWHWPQGQLYWGASSLNEMWVVVCQASFEGLPRWLATQTGENLMPAIDFLAIGILLWRAARSGSTAATLAGLFAAVLALAFLLHYGAFVLGVLKLPSYRTGLFFIPLAILLFGFSLAAPQKRILQVGGVGILVVNAAWFLACLRTSYFLEWSFNADTRHVYQLLQQLERDCGINDVTVEWRYSSALNFYRRYYHEERYKEFEPGFAPYPRKQPAYVLYQPTAREFIAKEQLRTYYSNPGSDTVIGVRSCPAQLD